MNRDDIITRVQRLLALGDKNRNNSSAEAELAASMAAKLMAEHRLERLDLDAEGDESQPLVDLDLHPEQTMRRVASWKSTLAGGIAGVNGCRIVNTFDWSPETGSTRKLVVLGRRSNAEAVHYLYRYLVREVDRVCRREARGRGSRYANAFRLGMVRRICHRLQQEHQARQRGMSAQTTALVRQDDEAVSAFVDSKFGDLKAAPPARCSSAMGLCAGIAAGGCVNLGGGKGLDSPAPRLKR